MESGDSSMINSWLIYLRQWQAIDTETLPTTSQRAVMNYTRKKSICSEQPLRAAEIKQQTGRDYCNADMHQWRL